MRRMLLCLLAMLLAAGAAGAQTKPKSSPSNLPTPQAAIQKCSEQATPLYASSEPEKLKRGDELRIKCLETAIIAQARQIFDKPNDAEKAWRGYLKELRAGYDGIWRDLLTETSHCAGAKTCGGNAWRSGDRYAARLEVTLTTILKDRKLEGY